MDREYTQHIDKEIDDAFETVEIIIRAKINRLCNELKYDEAAELDKALILINNTDFSKKRSQALHLALLYSLGFVYVNACSLSPTPLVVGSVTALNTLTTTNPST